MRQPPARVDGHGPQAGRDGQVGGRGRVPLQPAGHLEGGNGVEVPPAVAGGRVGGRHPVEHRGADHSGVPRAPPDGEAVVAVAGRIDLQQQGLQHPRRQVAGHEVEDVEVVGPGMAGGCDLRGGVDRDPGGRDERVAVVRQVGGLAAWAVVEHREAARPSVQPVARTRDRNGRRGQRPADERRPAPALDPRPRHDRSPRPAARRAPASLTRVNNEHRYPAFRQ